MIGSSEPFVYRFARPHYTGLVLPDYCLQFPTFSLFIIDSGGESEKMLEWGV